MIDMKYFVLITALFISTDLLGQRTYIHAGRLIDVENSSIREQATIIIENNRIVEVTNGYEDPGDHTLIDLKNKTVMPGLMDMHVHLEGQSSPKFYIERFTLDDIDVAFRSAVYAERTLMAGFTTVRDLGGSGVNIALRDAIKQGYAIGPRIYTAGKSIATTGGHADPTNGMKRDLTGDAGPKEGVADGPWKAKEAVRWRYKNGADLIKITATGGVLSVAKDGQGPQFTMEELTAIIETAKDYGMHVAAHAHGPEGMKRAVKAGITSIEHGTKMTPEVMELMKEHGTYYVPTISAGKFVTEKAEVPGYFPELVVPKAREIGPLIQDTFSEAYKSGVKIAFGTDAGVFPHGENAIEFIYMVEAGMLPIEAIRSATLTSAKLLGVDDNLGSIKEGKLADIVAVDGNPLEDIKAMQNISFVMKDGRVYKSTLSGKIETR